MMAVGRRRSRVYDEGDRSTRLPFPRNKEAQEKGKKEDKARQRSCFCFFAISFRALVLRFFLRHGVVLLPSSLRSSLLSSLFSQSFHTISPPRSPPLLTNRPCLLAALHPSGEEALLRGGEVGRLGALLGLHHVGLGLLPSKCTPIQNNLVKSTSHVTNQGGRISTYLDALRLLRGHLHHRRLLPLLGRRLVHARRQALLPDGAWWRPGWMG